MWEKTQRSWTQMISSGKGGLMGQSPRRDRIIYYTFLPMVEKNKNRLIPEAKVFQVYFLAAMLWDQPVCLPTDERLKKWVRVWRRTGGCRQQERKWRLCQAKPPDQKGSIECFPSALFGARNNLTMQAWMARSLSCTQVISELIPISPPVPTSKGLRRQACHHPQPCMFSVICRI